MCIISILFVYLCMLANYIARKFKNIFVCFKGDSQNLVKDELSMENQISEEINILLDTNYLYKDIASIKGENVVFICSFLNIFDFLASDRINIDGPINESKIERWRNAIEVGIINSELISLSHWHYLAKGQYGNIHITSNLVQMEDKAYLLTEKIINRKFSIKEDRDDLVFSR